jgi:hypothetical protein
MDKNSTLSGKCIIVLTILTFAFSFSSRAQAQAPKIKFRQPELVSGIDKQENATYKFPNVVSGVDAFIKIENITNGAILVNIDDSTLGYYDAWQPTVGGPGTYGSSYIKWDITFKTTAGVPYSFLDIDASAIDVDGDNVRVREFVDVNGQSSYEVPTQVPSMLTVTNESDTDNIYGDDPSPMDVHALGPVSNRAGIDTFSQDVRIDYHFTNTSKVKIYTGSTVENNGTTGAIASDRYHCIYFMKIQAAFSVLPVTYHSFEAIVNNDKVNISWISDVENSNGHFEIERSYDQKEFKTIGIIMGSQTANAVSGQYNFKDGDLELTDHKEVFYRLKYINMNEKFSYSTIKRVLMNTSKMNVQVMPNPYMDKLNVNFVSGAGGTAEIRLLNASGSLVKRMQSAISRGYNNLRLQDLNSQAPGLYIVNVIINGKVIESQKLIKQ